MDLFQASCLPPFGPAKAVQNCSRQFCDFLGYHFNGSQLTVADKTVEKHVLHYRQLYEQLRMKKTTSIEMASVLGLYVKRWQRWVASGLQGFAINLTLLCYDERNDISIGLTYGTAVSQYCAITKIDRFAVKEKGLKG
jgi:hypothetical protein